MWEITTYFVDPILLPKPLDVIKETASLLSSKEVYSSLLNTLTKTYMGVAGSLIAGLFFAVLAVQSKFIDRIINPITLIFQSAPIISWILLSLIWFDNSIIPIIVIIFSAFPIIFINSRNSIHNIEKRTRNFVKIYNIDKIKRIKGIYLPSIYITLKSSVRVVMELSLKISVMAEVISNATGGIGENLNNSWINIDTVSLLSITLILIMFTYINVKIVDFILRKIY